MCLWCRNKYRAMGDSWRAQCAAGFGEQIPLCQGHIPGKSHSSARRHFFLLQFLNDVQGCLVRVDYRVVSMHAPWHPLQTFTLSVNKQSKQAKPPCWVTATPNNWNLSELTFATKTICWLWLIVFFFSAPAPLSNSWTSDAVICLTATTPVLFVHCT